MAVKRADHQFIEICILAEQAHRQLTDLIQSSLSALGITDLNAVRAMILINMGGSEMTASDLLWRGCYGGSNVSYNLNKLVETGYVIRRRVDHDKRIIMVRVSGKGAALISTLTGMNADVFGGLNNGALTPDRLKSCGETLRSLQVLLIHAMDRTGSPRGLAA